MPMLHDPATRRSLEARLEALRPDAPPKWGSMTPDQMLWHLNQFLTFALRYVAPIAIGLVLLNGLGVFGG